MPGFMNILMTRLFGDWLMTTLSTDTIAGYLFGLYLTLNIGVKNTYNLIDYNKLMFDIRIKKNVLV